MDDFQSFMYSIRPWERPPLHPKYQPHIDGLRAIAVLSVLLYHVGTPGITGGFVGVDVFFVISGFLISRIVFSEVTSGNFSVVRFYERRARRILPAFMAVSLCAGVGVALLSMPEELVEFSRSLVAALLFVPNIFFYASSDYFAPAAETMPLLHYWSLGVEEQFYFLFPPLIILLARYAPTRLPHALIALFVASLVAGEVMLRFNPPASFYLLPFRAYEMLIGSIIALPSMPRATRPSVGGAASAVGLGLIAVALFTFDKSTSFPGVSALLPAVGSALVLWGSDRSRGLISGALSSPPLVWIGRVSYSLYLIHWPLILFARRLFPYADPGLRGGCVVVSSIALAFVSYWLIEQPFRQRRDIFTRPRLFAAAGASIAVLVGAAGVVMAKDGWPARLNERVKQIMEARAYNPTEEFRAGTCFLYPEQTGADIAPECWPKAGVKSVLLWGDSVAAQLARPLQERLEKDGYSVGQISASACSPYLDVDAPARPNCRGFNDWALSKVVTMKPDVLILAGGWLLRNPDEAKVLDHTVQTLLAAGIKPVLMGGFPRYRDAVPVLLADRISHGNDSPLSGPDLNAGDTFAVAQTLKQQFATMSDVRYVPVVELLCPDRECPMLLPGDKPVSYDFFHLTHEGSRYAAGILVPAILNLVRED